MEAMEIEGKDKDKDKGVENTTDGEGLVVVGRGMKKVPERDVVVVEYPGYLRTEQGRVREESKEKVLATLGGEEGVDKALSAKSDFLELRLRPSDPFSHPVYGDRMAATNFLLKVSKKPSSSGKVELQSEIVGRIGTVYRFQGMSDFQYLLPTSADKRREVLEYQSQLPSLNEEATTQATEEPTMEYNFNENKTELFIPPVMFSKQDSPFNYSFKPNLLYKFETVLESDGTATRKLMPKKKSAKIKLGFNANCVPELPSSLIASNNDEINSVLETEDDRVIYHKIIELLEERPIWSNDSIIHKLLNSKFDVKSSHVSDVTVSYTTLTKVILPLAAYKFSNGPFRNMWCKFGYDPRKDPINRKYQMINYRIKRSIDLPDTTFKAKPRRRPASPVHPATSSSSPKESAKLILLHSPSKRSYAEITFEVPPSQLQEVYQLCDICDETIQELLQSDPAPECSIKYGWFTEQTMTAIRKKMKERHIRLLRELGTNDSLLNEITGKKARKRWKLTKRTHKRKRKRAPRAASDETKEEEDEADEDSSEDEEDIIELDDADAEHEDEQDDSALVEMIAAGEDEEDEEEMYHIFDDGVSDNENSGEDTEMPETDDNDKPAT